MHENLEGVTSHLLPAFVAVICTEYALIPQQSLSHLNNLFVAESDNERILLPI